MKFNNKTNEGLLNYFQKLAKSKDGKLLSTKFLGMTKPHHWYCNKHDYDWWAKPTNLIDYPSKKGNWCPKCGHQKMRNKLMRYTIKDMQELAASKPGGGWFLSNKYEGVNRYHIWKCGACGHEWQAKPNYIIGKPSRPNGSWCPECANGKAERICRAFFEEIFRKKFHKEKNLDWLKEKRLHLDGYNEILKIAFETQGVQHFKFHSFFHNSDKEEFEKQIENDKYKKQLCEKNGIILIEVDYQVEFAKMEEYIRRKCLERGINLPKQSKKIDWREFNIKIPQKIKELQDLAKKREGKLLSIRFFGELVPLLWHCNKHDYNWWATPSEIRGKPSRPNGTWCPKCGKERFNNFLDKRRNKYLENTKQIVEKYSITIISRDYKNKMTPLKLKCNSCGNEWIDFRANILEKVKRDTFRCLNCNPEKIVENGG
ncbi:MAG: zinc-ribbon domain-containing protein [Candidatus Helarchaeota archaeon]|nr:zinc-ribbon domain-containing protein [Candidatus Helarchaeota archaeon]